MRNWAKITHKGYKPLGWWYHKIMCELKYDIYGSGKAYYFHLDKMCDKYKINLYGQKIE